MALTTSYQRLAQAYLGKSGGSLYVRLYARYSTQDIANNRTYVYLQARAYYENSSHITDNQASGNVSGAGLTKKSGSLSTIYTGETTIATTEGWVYHNNDGKKSISASAYLNFPNWGWSATASGNADLPTIPRHASITAAPNFSDEENPTINYSNPAGNAITSIRACISLTGAVDDIKYRDIPKTGSSYTFELTDDEREVLRNATLTSNTREVTFFVASVIGGVTNRSTLKKTLTIINAMPEIVISAKDVGAASTVLTGDENKIIKGFNYVLSSMSSTLKKGATIKSQTITNGSQQLIGEAGGTASMEGGFNNVESDTFIFGLTDSRGNTVNKYLTLDMINYIKLTCNLTVEKPTVDGVIKFNVSGNYFNDTFGAQYNYLALEYRIKKEGEDWSEWALITEEYTLNDNKYNVDSKITGLDYRKAYTIQVRVQDRIDLIPSAEKTVKATPVFDWGANDFNFNVPVTFEGKSLIDLIYPVGSIYMAVNYFDPATIFGGTWERIMDKFLLGSGAIYASGQEGGEATHTLTVAEMPSHSHKIWSKNTSGYDNGGRIVMDASVYNNKAYSGTVDYSTATIGSNQAHNNMPPYLTVNIWKRIS